MSNIDLLLNEKYELQLMSFNIQGGRTAACLVPSHFPGHLNTAHCFNTWFTDLMEQDGQRTWYPATAARSLKDAVEGIERIIDKDLQLIGKGDINEKVVDDFATIVTHTCDAVVRYGHPIMALDEIMKLADYSKIIQKELG